MNIYEVQNAQKTPIWKQRIIECRSSGKSVKEWCKEHNLDFTTYYRWERKILASMIPPEDIPALSTGTNPSLPASPNSIVKVELTSNPEEEDIIRFSVNGFEFSVPSTVSSAFLTRLLEAIKHAG